MTFRFHPEAERELREAVEYYEDIEPGLGYDLSVEVYSAVQRALAYPLAWPVLDGDIRRALVRRFPYGVLYSEEQGALLIIAVMNLHRAPGYWKDRR
jgi:plasmid stabilization system protein ParE